MINCHHMTFAILGRVTLILFFLGCFVGGSVYIISMNG